MQNDLTIRSDYSAPIIANIGASEIDCHHNLRYVRNQYAYPDFREYLHLKIPHLT